MNSFTDWDSELYHHGIKGQKWGVRRYQNEDGSLTAAGKQRYTTSSGKLEYNQFHIDINQKNPLTSKSRAARSILKNEINKQDDLKKLTQNLKSRKRDAKTVKAEKAIDSFLRKKFNVSYIKESQENGTVQMARKLVQDIIKDNRTKIDPSEQLNRLTLKDHLGAAAIGALAGPYAANAYTSRKLADERKKKK